MNYKLNQYFFFIVLFGFLLLGHTAFANNKFAEWKQEYREFAIQKGISKTIIDQVFKGLQPDPMVIKLNNHQPEFSKPIWEYLDNAASKQRVQMGRKKFTQHQELLTQISFLYSIPAEYILAIWGIESSYGQNYGNMNVVRSLATLAFKSKRKEFARQELLSALRILDAKELELKDMIGSWAGAMRHTQFMPSTYERYAVDFDDDGKKDLVNSVADALASTANYLSELGWNENQTWGAEIKLPRNFNFYQAKPSIWFPIEVWENERGIRSIYNTRLSKNLPNYTRTSVFLPAGSRGPKFLLYPNFKIIKEYNHSNSYALSVVYLGDQIKFGRKFISAWPREDKMLSHQEKIILQQLLTAAVYDTKGIDGQVGANTREAIRIWQKQVGLPADGYINRNLLYYLEQNL